MIRPHINTHTKAQVPTPLCYCPTSSFILIIFAGCVLLIKSQMSIRNNVKLGPYALLTFSFKTNNRLVVEMNHMTFNIKDKKYCFPIHWSEKCFFLQIPFWFWSSLSPPLWKTTFTKLRMIADVREVLPSFRPLCSFASKVTPLE